jgi:hypothetical protein
LRRFGSDIASAIEILTVDRRDTSKEYKVRYYDRIAAAPARVQQVKSLDKFDNLFLLCLNPSETVRLDYLAEIDEFVVPMVRRKLPQMQEYFLGLVADCRAIGHLKIDPASALRGGS